MRWRRRGAAMACQLGCSASCGTLYSSYSLAVAFGWPLPLSALGSGEARCVSEAVSCVWARGVVRAVVLVLVLVQVER